MSTPFTQQLNADIKAAMKGGDKQRLGALRLIAAAVKQHEVDQRSEVDEATAIELLTRMAKQRRESIAQYEQAGRDDLAATEHFELGIIETYLPAQMDPAEIDAAINEAIAASGAASMKDMGKVMGVLGGKLKGRADMGAVSARVKALLAG